MAAWTRQHGKDDEQNPHSRANAAPPDRAVTVAPDDSDRQSGVDRQTWVFQANPRQFDISGYLQTKSTDFLWLARQRAAKMAVGDRVFV